MFCKKFSLIEAILPELGLASKDFPNAPRTMMYTSTCHNLLTNPQVHTD